MCYKHDEKQPVEEIIAHPCIWYVNYDKTQIDPALLRTCDFDLLSGKYAWVDETKQQYLTGVSEQSDLKGKRTEAYCREVSSFN